MKKAVNINELANNLIPENFLKPEDKDVYVPIYEDILEVLRNMIINDQVESQAFFVAGQAGTGKTTALNFFKTEALEEHYHIKFINMRDFLDLSDVDIINFLLAFAFALVKENHTIEDKYYEKLVEIQKKHDGELIESVERESGRKIEAKAKGEASIGGGFLNFIKLRAGFFSNLQMDSDYRETTREVFKLKKPCLHKLINEMIDEYVKEITEGKKLLVIIDDLDKVRELGQINSIFIENRNYIFSLKCKKIISIPNHLTRVPEISNYSQYPIRQFVLRLSFNPFNGETKTTKEEGKKIDTNRQMLRDVVKYRIAEGHFLIDADALEKAIDYSGGIIRQLIQIVRVAAVSVRTLGAENISLRDVSDAINLLRNTLAGTITSSKKIKLLSTVRDNKIPDSESAEGFIELLHANNVLAYVNGEPWYVVNPLISETVKVYASRLKE
jgi:DNA polymerase III delta prime subunit